MHEEHPGTDELERRLGAYASARLAPDRIAVTRMRSSVIEEARMHVLDSRLSRRRNGRRRLTAFALAATLTVGGAASVAAASNAGGPLYPARIWLETAAMSPDQSTRALERLHQVDARVLDLERAASAGDQNAVAAAINAYRDAVATAVDEAESGPDNDRLETLKAALGLHLAVLERLWHRVPDKDMEAIGHAIDASNKAVDRINAPKRNNDHGGGGTTKGGAGRTGAPSFQRFARPTASPSATSPSGSQDQGGQDH
ncbi:MAG: hypothetical protein ABI573_09575 [Chloroflexota bacterium]